MFFLGYTLSHSDGSCGANQSTQVATYTFCSYNARLTAFWVKFNGLMSAVVA